MERNERSARLVKQAMEVDSSAFEELYQSTYKGVLFHAQKILKNEQDVEDAVSETYLRAYENLAKLKDPALFQAWVNRIVTNLAMNMLRDDHYRDAPSFDDEDFFYEPVAADADTPNMVLDRRGTEEIVGGMIEALPETQRTTVILYYYDEMSVSAIAKTMGCSEGTVKSRLNYARKNLEQAVLAEEKRFLLELLCFTQNNSAFYKSQLFLFPDSEFIDQARSAWITAVGQRIDTIAHVSIDSDIFRTCPI